MCKCWEIKGKYLLVDSIELLILGANFTAHIDSHISQIADHCAHLSHIFFHLIFSSVFRNPIEAFGKLMSKLHN